MTETKWLACRTSRTMFDFLRGRLTERKLRFIGCGCLRVCWPKLSLAEIRAALEAAERIADRVASDEEIAEAFRQANYARNMATGTVADIPKRYKQRGTRCAAWAVYELVESLDYDDRGEYLDVLHGCVSTALAALEEVRDQPSAEVWRQARVIRDIVGNPFRPVTFNPAWRTSDVTLLAQRIYDAREFGAMPILADAIQDAGCDSGDILDHFRDTTQVHVRGCWALDLVLGKS